MRIVIPGEPFALRRARTAVVAGRARVYDPKENRSWKAEAAWHMQAELAKQGLKAPLIPEGPVYLEVIASFTCPKGAWRKRSITPERWKTTKPDLDNIVKAVKDAAKGVLWLDDAQVVQMRCRKTVAAQGVVPSVVILVYRLEEAA